MKLVNDVITNIIDPNLFYSRLSFYESNREAIHIKHEVREHYLLASKVIWTSFD